MTKTSKSLVTGGAGFIGSHVARRLLAEGHEVTVLDSHIGHGIVPNVRYVKGSVTDGALVEQLVAGHDYVFHLAARLGVKTTMSAPAEMIENNLQGTMNVLQAASKYGKKVVFASSSEVYGKGKPPFAEDDDLLYGPTRKLRWSYATAKLVEEFLCLGYGRKGLPVTVVRYFNVYGPGQKEGPYGGVVPKFIRAALAGEDIPVYGRGDQTRCFTYVDDAAEATVRALRPEADQEIINIGTDEEIPIMALARRIKLVTGSASNIVTIPHETVYPYGFEEIPRRLPRTAKMKSLLGFAPRTALTEGLVRTVQWYRDNDRRAQGE
ncbi:NAD-dependent epimerase/dehydratase family protein [Paenibacillus sp.]|uniref:NAD-dependent epimerase/dehydratase family protein n=1 Tax=Paenibacillus sp. TaxID=58172 RepID=UPI002D45F6B3|nr:NAD-dependent epimerase/dehydratase family protein [Paenibacillus sp.]HZG58287.1 NAD-dependent epimerase/dehydratase family protein [Paenibacillus sp.]